MKDLFTFLFTFLSVLTLASIVSAADSSAVTQAAKQRNDVQLEFNKAKNVLNVVTNRLKAQFEARPEWTAAVNAEREAKKEYDTARETALAAVRAQPEYTAKAAELKTAEAEVEKLRGQRVDVKEMTRVATAAADLRSGLSKMEFDAIAQDSNVTAAKQKWADAQAVLNQLKKNFDEICKANVEWQTQKKVVDEIEVRLKEADKQVAEARKAQAQAAAAEAKSRAANRRSRSSGGGGGIGY